jgi:hypothetical protein
MKICEHIRKFQHLHTDSEAERDQCSHMAVLTFRSMELLHFLLEAFLQLELSREH